MEKMIWLDCDGTWIDLYGVEGWLNDILNEDVRPYREAKPLVNLSLLSRTIHQLQKENWKIGIISWTAKGGSPKYNKAVEQTKIEWFKKHLPSVQFDEIHIVEYGTPKWTIGKGYLFDDESKNRNEWNKHGNRMAYTEKELIQQLRAFI